MISTVLWGFGGIAGQLAFSISNISSFWLLTVRMLTAGAVLLTIAFIRDGKKIFNIFKTKEDLIPFAVYCFLGNWLVQYSYFEAIRYSNAAAATLLQYLSPGIILLVTAVLNKKLPTRFETICVFTAFLGLFLVSTHGSFTSLAISKMALFWGLISASSLVINNIVPLGLLKKYGAYTVVGFAMLIGGITTQLIMSPLTQSFDIPAEAWKYIIFVAIFGTTIPFAGYSAGIKIVGPTIGSIVGNMEPVTAALVSVVFLHTEITAYDAAGFCLIIGVAVALSLFDKNSD